jgi:hypothetical protein
MFIAGVAKTQEAVKKRKGGIAHENDEQEA